MTASNPIYIYVFLLKTKACMDEGVCAGYHFVKVCVFKRSRRKFLRPKDTKVVELYQNQLKLSPASFSLKKQLEIDFGWLFSSENDTTIN